MSKKQKISNPKDHFTILPNMYDDANLTVHEFRLLVHYRRVGNCYEAVRTTAKKCHMSIGSVVKARNGLKDRWIKVSKSDSQNDTVNVVVLDRWTRTPTDGGSDEGCSPDEHLEDECSPDERGVHVVNTDTPEGCSPGEPKKYLKALRSTNQEDDVPEKQIPYDQLPWKKVLSVIRGDHYQGNKAGWETSPWCQTWVVAGSDGNLVVGCTTEDDATWLADRGAAVARHALTGVLGCKVDVEFLGPAALQEVMSDAA